MCTIFGTSCWTWERTPLFFCRATRPADKSLPLRCLPCQGPSCACAEVPTTAWLFRADFFRRVAAPIPASPRAPLRLLAANSRGSAAWHRSCPTPPQRPATAAGTGTDWPHTKACTSLPPASSKGKARLPPKLLRRSSEKGSHIQGPLSFTP